MTASALQLIHDNIHQRQSIGQLIEPAPDTAQLNLAFAAALTAPDHHRLKPTQFIVIDTAQRAAFGSLLSAAMADLGETDPVQIERVKLHPFRAPILVIAVTKIQQHAKVPEFEQILSTGAAIQNLLLSLQAQGFASMWRSGAVVESVFLKHALGLQAQDIISGIIYLGTAAKVIPIRESVTLTPYVSHWVAAESAE
ncbi:nitroreductase [Acinetobacter calcoaceticus]|uniref:Putative NAD(P)H nitroreductase n=1 Tax=Acinetobacter calcoaceticus TaxID=471 RepID=A0A4R1XC18_ACICA|nr:nitroreductase [Acinetobacter calcoaceticus]